MDRIVFDCETQKLFSEIKDRTKVWDLKLSTAVTYSYKEDLYRFWTYSAQNDLIKYLSGNFVIGFNSITFDSPLLLGEKCVTSVTGQTSSDGVHSWTNFDILFECKKHLYALPKDASIAQVNEEQRKNFSVSQRGVYSLDSICTATLNHKKNGHGENAVDLFRSKRIKDLLEYNLQDVRLTKQLYDFIKKHGYLVNGAYDIIQF